MSYTIKLTDAVAREESISLREPVNLTIGSDENVAIVGRNGSGKSLLVDMMTGKSMAFGDHLEHGSIRYITFRDTYGAADKGYYIQQRWNTTEYDDVRPVSAGLGNWQDNPFQKRLVELFGLDELMDKPLILLSSGELRKYQITKMLLQKPRTLIVDNPYIGLDAGTRDQLTRFFTEFCQEGEVQIIIVMSVMDEIPEFVSHVVLVEDRRVVGKFTREEYLSNLDIRIPEGEWDELDRKILGLKHTGVNYTGEHVIDMKDVTIRYGERTILKDVNWSVRRGQRWHLAGENGAGKSTLLSLVCADNPQAYACDIVLFDKQRGSGETIWDIKKHIGYVSPEMHRAYIKNVDCVDIVSTGLHDRVGLFLKHKEEDLELIRFWMEVFGVAQFMYKSFLSLSSGEQRLVLLARAFVKDPELIILDEPLHGLDTYNKLKVKHIIETFCRREDKTLVMVTHYDSELPPIMTDKLFLKRNK
ncbi:MAG: ATP-binding cassette domain-containing protein [Bacteroidales bacterium]|nr:ATP-binding cassette domain-containing protein [Bacteroidales bacterium]